RANQDQLHVARELGQEAAQRRRRLLDRQRVRSVGREPPRGLTLRQARLGDHPEQVSNVLRVERIPALDRQRRALASFVHRSHRDSSPRIRRQTAGPTILRRPSASPDMADTVSITAEYRTEGTPSAKRSQQHTAETPTGALAGLATAGLRSISR